MEPYIFVYLILLFGALWFDSKPGVSQEKHVVMLTGVLLLTLFRGLRWETGTDWDQYYEVFRFANWSNIFNYVRYDGKEEILEAGYVFSNVLIKELGFDYTGYLLISNFFVLFVYYKVFWRYAEYPILSFVVLIFTLTFFPVRQVFAAGIVFYGYGFILDKKPLKYFITVFLAALVHTSAIIAVPAYFFLRARVSSKLSYIVAVLAILCSNVTFQMLIINFIISHFSFLGDMVIGRLVSYTTYDRRTVDYRNPILGYLIFFGTLFLINNLKNRAEYKDSRTFQIFYNAYLLYFVFGEVFRNSMEQFARMSNYFIFGFPFLFPLVLKDCKIGKVHTPIVHMAFVLYMVYKLFNSLTNFYPEIHIPYKSVIYSYSTL